MCIRDSQCTYAQIPEVIKWGKQQKVEFTRKKFDLQCFVEFAIESEISETKSPFKYGELWKIFSVWAILKGIQLPAWKEFENTPKRRIKGRFDSLIKIRKFI